MANITVPHGLHPYRHDGGGSVRTTSYLVPASNATALFCGDPVVRLNSGIDATYKLPQVGRAGTTGAMTGVMAGFEPLASITGFSAQNLAVSTLARLLVWDDPNTLFTIRGDGSTLTDAASVQTAVGLNASPTFATAGSTVTGYSGAMLDESTLATTAALPLHIVGFVDQVDNELDDYPVFIVKINNHTQAHGATGI